MNTRLGSVFTVLISQCVTAFLVVSLSFLTACRGLNGSSAGFVQNPAPMMSLFRHPVYIYMPSGLKPSLKQCSSARAPAHNFEMSLSEFIKFAHQLSKASTAHSFEFMHPFRMKLHPERYRLKNNRENYA